MNKGCLVCMYDSHRQNPYYRQIGQGRDRQNLILSTFPHLIQGEFIGLFARCCKLTVVLPLKYLSSDRKGQDRTRQERTGTDGTSLPRTIKGVIHRLTSLVNENDMKSIVLHNIGMCNQMCVCTCTLHRRARGARGTISMTARPK